MTRDRPQNLGTLQAASSKEPGLGSGLAQPLGPPRARQDRILWEVEIESEREVRPITVTLRRTRHRRTARGRREGKAAGKVALPAQGIRALDLDRLGGGSVLGGYS